jgi:hypothetical protein
MAEVRAPIIVTAALGRADQAWAEGLRRRHYPPERNQVPAHISLFHHLPPSLETELRAMLKALAAAPAPAARIEGLHSLGAGVAIGLSSPGLMAIRDVIAERFARHLIPQDRHPPRLHITIQNKVEPATARATLAALREEIAPRSTEIAALLCWHYCDGPWQAISRHVFRR